jgi:hypothetical protein
MTNKARLKSIEEIRNFLEDALKGAKDSPPSTRYELGYCAAIEELERLTDPAGYRRA